MRIRSTKPEFWRSKRIAVVDWETRFVLKGLESYVDDNGVGKDDLELIVTDLFSRDVIREPSRTFKRVQVAVNTLSEAGLVWRYEVDGTDLLYVSWWDSTQYINRPSKGRLRRPDGTLEYGESEIGSSLKSPQEPSSNFSAGTGEQGIRGTVTSASADAERDFEDWYQHYPRKRGKGQALTAYKKARKTVAHETLVSALKAQTSVITSKGTEFVPYPATWLNGQRWDDDLTETGPAGGSDSDSLWDRLERQANYGS